jgi:hypothetical protein
MKQKSAEVKEIGSSIVNSWEISIPTFNNGLNNQKKTNKEKEDLSKHEAEFKCWCCQQQQQQQKRRQ